MEPADTLEPARLEERRRINLDWLLRLRWGAVAGQVATILVVDRWMGIRLPLGWLFALVALEAGSNVAAHLRAGSRRKAIPEWLAPALMVLDVLVLTGLLYLTGGAFNPFSFLYLVQIALAAVILRARWTWPLVALSMACSAVLFLQHRPLPLPAGGHANHMMVHLHGMWVAFGVAAAFIVYFLMRITGALAEREAELEAARKRTERNEKLASLATLAAGAAHELSTPLGTIALAASELERRLLSMPGASAENLEDARLIRSQVQRCREILDRMAADAGQSAGETIEAVPLAQVLRVALADLEETPVVRLEVGEDLAGASYPLPRRAVALALRGLVKNAQQACAGREGAEVVVRAASEGGGLRLEVRDTGCGMSPEVLARAGEPFFTTKPPGRGMGLGLFLARALVEGLGGGLSFASAPGEGTAVTVVLPPVRPGPETAPIRFEHKGVVA